MARLHVDGHPVASAAPIRYRSERRLEIERSSRFEYVVEVDLLGAEIDEQLAPVAVGTPRRVRHGVLPIAFQATSTVQVTRAEIVNGRVDCVRRRRRRRRSGGGDNDGGGGEFAQVKNAHVRIAAAGGDQVRANGIDCEALDFETVTRDVNKRARLLVRRFAHVVLPV